MLTSNAASLRVVQSLEQTKAGLRFKDVKAHRSRAINLPSFVVERASAALSAIRPNNSCG